MHDKPSAEVVLSAIQNPKQASLITRHAHSLLLLEERYRSPLPILISQIRVMLATCASLRNLLLPVGYNDPEMRLNLLEHAPPTLRRIRFIGEEFEVSQLSTIPQATLQNLTQLRLYLRWSSPHGELFLLYGALSNAYHISLGLDSFGLYGLVSPPWSHRVIST
jgi:hypothetical protein